MAIIGGIPHFQTYPFFEERMNRIREPGGLFFRGGGCLSLQRVFTHETFFWPWCATILWHLRRGKIRWPSLSGHRIFPPCFRRHRGGIWRLSKAQEKAKEISSNNVVEERGAGGLLLIGRGEGCLWGIGCCSLGWGGSLLIRGGGLLSIVGGLLLIGGEGLWFNWGQVGGRKSSHTLI